MLEPWLMRRLEAELEEEAEVERWAQTGISVSVAKKNGGLGGLLLLPSLRPSARLMLSAHL